MKKPLALIILDGFGLTRESYGNAIEAARTPTLDRIFSEGSMTSLSASGLDVGLPEGQMGNSEVGHMNMGAGRVVYQELTRISKEIREGRFFKNEVLLAACRNCLEHGTALHLMGLIGPGGVHSHSEHLSGLIELARQQGLTKVFLHCFTDGRDTPPTSGRDFLEELGEELKRAGIGAIATVCGRYYAMDRDNRWERVERAYLALVHGKGIFNPDPVAALERSYAAGVTDEFVEPIVCLRDAKIEPNDSVIFFNFRSDRARELSRALVDPVFDHYQRIGDFFPLHFVCMTQYDVTMPNVHVAYPPDALVNTLGEYVSLCGLRQLRIAETEKYAHVTFFFNGGRELQFDGEDRALIPSPKVATYDLKPEMSANEVTDELIRRIEAGDLDLIILNYANCDMVGHTGVFSATVAAIEAVDACLARALDALLRHGGAAFVTADHGNAEMMYEPDGSPFTAHTTNRVPFAAVGLGPLKLRENGKLADIAPTILEVLGLRKPREMDGRCLIIGGYVDGNA